MKVKYIGKGSLKSKGLLFEKDVEYDLTQEIFDYVTTTFSVAFEILDIPKVVVKEVIPEVKPEGKRKKPNKAPISEKE